MNILSLLIGLLSLVGGTFVLVTYKFPRKNRFRRYDAMFTTRMGIHIMVISAIVALYGAKTLIEELKKIL
ncbi:hypothetical protein [Pedobacter steynii]|uniref:Uncharacterized protein n=1 Tax=Pedobacter steynii TaxID=430522 RepID=A0A1D7QMK3_9SPHI|nr:hypothetical protein [Pedobacter steynii]AOM79849.1 hypothetical protein BFS30_23400 [Pedobacter steynii]